MATLVGAVVTLVTLGLALVTIRDVMVVDHRIRWNHGTPRQIASWCSVILVAVAVGIPAVRGIRTQFGRWYALGLLSIPVCIAVELALFGLAVY